MMNPDFFRRWKESEFVLFYDLYFSLRTVQLQNLKWLNENKAESIVF
jgi:hypothetical protein